MFIIKLLCFLLIVHDTFGYVCEKFEDVKDGIVELNIWYVIFVILGLLARVYLLYGAFVYWVLK